MNKIQYQKEQDKLLTTLLEQRYFFPWLGSEALEGQYSLRNDSSVEIYLTTQCNQNCSYCYLREHPELYPQDKMNPELLLHNLTLIYEWLLEHNYYIKTLDFFSGDIWQTQFGLDVLQLTYDYMQKGMMFDSILIASNCSFVNDSIQTAKIQKYIDMFNQCGHPLVFSISVDGKLIDNYGRPRNQKELIYTDRFYELLFSFAKHNTFYFHPMVSASTIHLWHDNLKWWKEMTKKYKMRFDIWVMMLEVRNNDWTDETIKKYCDFIIELAEDFLKTECHNNLQMFGNILGNIRLSGDLDNLPLLNGYYPWAFGTVDSFMGCNIGSYLVIRVGDLAICPCHRSAYDKYLYGFFNVENDKITGITARNPQMAIKILMGHVCTTSPKCDICLYNDICLRGCIGSQIETMHDPFIPIPSVCAFFKAKYSTIIKWYKEKGIIDYWKTINPTEYRSDELAEKLNFIDKWEREEYGMGNN